MPESPAVFRRGEGPIRIDLEHGGKCVDHRLTAERWLAGQHLEQHAPEGPDVGTLVDGLSLCLLGTHVGGGAEDRAFYRHTR
jgi:hypothetical protein